MTMRPVGQRLWTFRTFDVSMELHFAVKIVEPLQDFPQDDLDVALLELAGLHEVQGGPTPKVFHDDP